MHVEFLLEEPSAEAFLNLVVEGMLPPDTTWNFIVFQGKADLLKNLEARLRAYKKWIPEDYKIVILVDEDRSDCKILKLQLEQAASAAKLATRSSPGKHGKFVVLNRIAVEEIEAWFFGDVPALCKAYPKVPSTLGAKASFRNPDAIGGGTWEALERVLQSAGYYAGGLPKIEVARAIGAHANPSKNKSKSFVEFRNGLTAL